MSLEFSIEIDTEDLHTRMDSDSEPNLQLIPQDNLYPHQAKQIRRHDKDDEKIKHQQTQRYEQILNQVLAPLHPKRNPDGEPNDMRDVSYVAFHACLNGYNIVNYVDKGDQAKRHKENEGELQRLHEHHDSR